MKHFLALSIIMLVGVGCTGTGAQPQNATMDVAGVTITTQIPTKRMLDGQKDLASMYSKAVIHTSHGDMTVSFLTDVSPITVNNFMNLAERNFYNGTSFHRIINNFMIQGGDPLSADQEVRGIHGTGGPGYTFVDEINDIPLLRGSVAMANAGPNTNGSQFFIITATDTPWLDGKHTHFGDITHGLDLALRLQTVETDANDNPIIPISITSIELQK